MSVPSDYMRSDQRLEQLARERPNDKAIGCDGQWLSFGEWWSRASTIAEDLTASRAQGRPIAINMPSRSALTFAVAYVGCHRARCTAVPLNHRLAPGEIDFQVREAGAVFLVDDQLTLTSSQPDGVALQDQAGDVLADILFTSGTTGTAKGTMVTHAGHWSTGEATAAHIYGGLAVGRSKTPILDRRGCIVTTFPPYSSMSLESVMNVALYAGCAQHYISHFDGELFSSQLDDLNATVVLAPPAIYALWRQSNPRPSRSPRTYVTAGAPISRDLAAWVLDFVGDVSHLVNYYGLTEAGMFVAVDEELTDHVGAIGRPVPPTVARIVDEEGNEADAGELLIADANVMEGYVNRPDLTSSTIVDGWFRTADLVVKEGEVICLRGRREEWINRGGYKIYPAEVEDLTARVAGVIDSAALGVPHDVLGEDIRLCVEVDPSMQHRADEIEREIRELLLEELADYKQPRVIQLIPSLPRNSNGKVARKELLKLVAGEESEGKPR